MLTCYNTDVYNDRTVIVEDSVKGAERSSSWDARPVYPKRRALATEKASTGTFDLLGVFDLPQWKIVAFQKLSSLESLGHNWDGYGSPSVSSATRRAAATILAGLQNSLLPNPTVAPTSGGGIQIEWEIGRNAIELHISPELELHYLLVLPNTEDEGELDIHDRTRINALVSRVL